MKELGRVLDHQGIISISTESPHPGGGGKSWRRPDCWLLWVEVAPRAPRVRWAPSAPSSWWWGARRVSPWCRSAPWRRSDTALWRRWAQRWISPHHYRPLPARSQGSLQVCPSLLHTAAHFGPAIQSDVRWEVWGGHGYLLQHPQVYAGLVVDLPGWPVFPGVPGLLGEEEGLPVL